MQKASTFRVPLRPIIVVDGQIWIILTVIYGGIRVDLVRSIYHQRWTEHGTLASREYKYNST